jgi:hypothetical protein
MSGIDRIRQQPSGSRETGEHCRSSTMPPVCASAWRNRWLFRHSGAAFPGAFSPRPGL